MQKIIDYRFQSDSGVSAPGFKINYYFHNDTDDMTNKGSTILHTYLGGVQYHTNFLQLGLQPLSWEHVEECLIP